MREVHQKNRYPCMFCNNDRQMNGYFHQHLLNCQKIGKNLQNSIEEEIPANNLSPCKINDSIGESLNSFEIIDSINSNIEVRNF